MRAIAASLAALLVLAAASDPADAASPRKKRHHAGQYAKTPPSGRPSQAYRNPSAGNGDYYEHVLDRVPFGSDRWWRIYEEQSGTPF